MSTPRPRTDIPELLGVTRRARLAGWVIGVIVTVGLVAADPGANPLAAWFAAFLLIGAAAAVLLPDRNPLDERWTAAGVVLVVATSAASVGTPLGDAPGFAPWSLRATVGISALLIARGRSLAGWGASGGAFGVFAIWVLMSHPEPLVWIGVAVRPLAALVVAQVFVAVLSRVARSIDAHHESERIAVRNAELRVSRARRRRAELRAIRRLVAPMLRRIADAAITSPGAEDPGRLRKEASSLEAELRDVLRGSALAVEPLVSASRRARARGLDVVLLDDLGAEAIRGARRRSAVSWASRLLDESVGPRVTVRASRDGQGRVLVSFVEGGEEARLHLFEVES